MKNSAKSSLALDKDLPAQLRIAAILGSIFSTRLLGLFMILPVFSLYAERIAGATPLLIGIALGIYGLTQASLQIPFGMASDYFGRKKVITIGLLIFALGSVVAASSSHIIGIILGRALQGAGAIGSTIMALTADLTVPEHRSKAMAIMGMIIGLSFTLAMGLGPLINDKIGISGIFGVTAVLAIGGIIILYRFVPTPKKVSFHKDAQVEPARFSEIIFNTQLLRLNLGILILHFVLTASFMAIPLILQQQTQGVIDNYSYFYVVLLALSFLLMIPGLILAERNNWLKPLFVSAIALLFLSLLWLLMFSHNLMHLMIGLLFFFLAFSYLEATLPALVSRLAPANSKGTAMGVYSTSQFLGIFLGGTAGGILYGLGGSASIFVSCLGVVFIWLLLAITMKKPTHVTHFMINVGSLLPTDACRIKEKLLAIEGVIEAVIEVSDGIAYLKIDKYVVDKDKLHKFSIS